MSAHFDADGWCQCACPICAPIGCGRAGHQGDCMAWTRYDKPQIGWVTT